MRYLRNPKVWGLGFFLMVLLFTTVFSQEQPPPPRTGVADVETKSAGNPSTAQPSPASPGIEAEASLGPKRKPANVSELSFYVRKSLKEHPVTTNLCLAGALLGIILINLAIRQIFLYGLKLEEWNHTLEAKGAKPVNGRRITNIGTFRIYVEKYLRSLKTVNPNQTLLVRQLQPSDTGRPADRSVLLRKHDRLVYIRANPV